MADSFPLFPLSKQLKISFTVIFLSKYYLFEIICCWCKTQSRRSLIKLKFLPAQPWGAVTTPRELIKAPVLHLGWQARTSVPTLINQGMHFLTFNACKNIMKCGRWSKISSLSPHKKPLITSHSNGIPKIFCWIVSFQQLNNCCYIQQFIGTPKEWKYTINFCNSVIFFHHCQKKLMLKHAVLNHNKQ